jgi:hypothetical protein
MHIYDLIRVAIQEFIERRPEYFDEGFNYHNFKYGHSNRKKK